MAEMPEVHSSSQEGYSDTVGFHWADYLIFVLTLVLSLGIGLYTSCHNRKTTADYLTGSKKMHMFPVAMSMFMSVISSILILGNSAEVYFYGTQIWMESIGKTAFHIISGYLFVPVMYRLKVTSMFEYHQKRFKSRIITLAAVCLTLITNSLYMGLAMFAPSTALEAVTGFPVWASIVCTGVVAVIYTTMGGIKAVVWTDFLQGFIMFAGLLVVLIMGCIKVGGLATVWEVSDEAERIIFFNMDPDPTVRMTFWGAVFGATMYISQSGADQAQIQRYCSLPTMKDAKRAVYLQGPLLIIVFVLICLCGLTAFAYYELLGCDPFRSGQISNFNQIVPYFVVDALNYPGLSGLFVAVLFSGALSSLSSSMTSLTAITWKTFIEMRVTHLSEIRKTLITKALAPNFGRIAEFPYRKWHHFELLNPKIAVALLGGIYGPVTGLVMAGAMFPCVQWKGALAGLILGLGTTWWMNIGQFIFYPNRSYLDTNVDNCTFPENATARPIPDNLTDVFWLYRVSHLYIPLIGWSICIFSAVVVSQITGRQDPKELDPMTVINLSDRFGWCCNEDQKEKFWCGVSYDELDKEATEEKDKTNRESATESRDTKDDIQEGVLITEKGSYFYNKAFISESGENNGCYTPEVQFTHL